MMLPPALCGAIGAILLLPFAWTHLASALRAHLHGQGRDQSLSDRTEKIVLATMLAPTLIGLGAVLAALAPASSGAPPLIEFAYEQVAAMVAPISALPTETTPAAAFPWMQAIISAFAWIYGAGVLFAAARLIAAQWRIARISAPAEDASAAWGEGVCLTDAETPPFVGPRKRIILPHTLIAALAPEQIALVIAHERAHVRRGDAFYYALLAWVDALAWFNPFVRAQTQRCRMAAELACDAAVTAAAPEMRRAYAQALISALKHTAGDALQCAPAVFSTRIVGEHRMRIREIMQAAPSRRKRSGAAVYIAACFIAAPLATLQLALAESHGAQPVVQAPAPSANTPAATSVFGVAPINAGISSAYGPRINPNGGGNQFHNGVDYTAPEGAAIVAPASGRVTRAVTQGGYGMLLEIDHGAGLITRYAHLSGFDVREGDAVSAGQLIARVGNTGLSTHPHLHFVVLRNGEAVDPATVLPRG